MTKLGPTAQFVRRWLNSVSSVFLGISGWQHRPWQESFYPQTLGKEDQLAYYATQFGCVEIAESFFHLPERHTFARWVESTPQNFQLSVLAPRVITHYKKLKNCENQIDTLFTRLRGLETKIGPVVFQLPSRWHCNLRRLEEFSRRLPESFGYVFEFQDATWHTRDVFKLLEKNGFGLTVPLDDPSRPSLITTSDIVYLRLRSPKNSKTGSYHPQTLRGWAGRIHGWTRKGKNVYVLFDGEDSSAVLKNAQRIRKYLEPPAKTLPCV